MEGLQVIVTNILKDKNWGFSDLLNGRNIEDAGVKAELIELLQEDLFDILEGAKFEFKIIE